MILVLCSTVGDARRYDALATTHSNKETGHRFSSGVETDGKPFVCRLDTISNKATAARNKSSYSATHTIVRRCFPLGGAATILEQNNVWRRQFTVLYCTLLRYLTQANIISQDYAHATTNTSTFCQTTTAATATQAATAGPEDRPWHIASPPQTEAPRPPRVFSTLLED